MTPLQRFPVQDEAGWTIGIVEQTSDGRWRTLRGEYPFGVIHVLPAEADAAVRAAAMPWAPRRWDTHAGTSDAYSKIR